MRIAYFAHVNGGRTSGVFHKIVAQITEWRAQAATVRAFVMTRDSTEEWQSSLGDAVICRYRGRVSQLGAVTKLVRAIRQFDPHIAYVRRDLFWPQLFRMPARAALILEVNEDDLHEYALGPWLPAFYNARTRGLLLGRARAIVFVTSELSGHPSFRGFRARHEVIANGIRLSEYPSLTAKPDGSPRLVFIGSAGQTWQGTDKLVTLATLRPDWRFDVVGMLNDTSDAPSNIEWHGPMDRADAFVFLARADIGVGTLALHRKSMDESSSLKHREYLAVGLPLLYGNRDPDADKLEPYVLRLDNTESNVVDDLPRIDAFVARSRGVRVPRYLVAHIDVGCKERQRLELFDDLAHD